MDFSKLSDLELRSFLGQHGVYGSGTPSNRINHAAELFQELQANPDTIYPESVVDLYIASFYEGPRDQSYTQDEVIAMDDATLNIFAQIFGIDSTGLTHQRLLERVLRILRFLDLIVPDVSLPLAGLAAFSPNGQENIQQMAVPALADSHDLESIITPDINNDRVNLSDLTQEERYEFDQTPIIFANGPILLRMVLPMTDNIIVRDYYLTLGIMGDIGSVTKGQILDAIIKNNAEMNRYFRDYELEVWEAGEYFHNGRAHFEMDYFEP